MIITLANNPKDCLIRDFRVGQFFTILSAMPGRKKWVDNQLVFQPSGANIEYLLANLPELDWHESASKFRDGYLELKMQEENTRASKQETLTDSSGYEHKVAPFKHQEKAFLVSRDRNAFALFHEQGTGKTKVIIDTAAYLFEKGEIDTLIVIASNGAHINWVLEEIPVHMPDRIPYQSVYFSINWRDAELRNMMAAARSRQPGVLQIITFYIEGVRYLRDGSEGKMQELILAWMKNTKLGVMTVVDESTIIKNHSTDQTKFVVKCRVLSKYRRIMTGTPLTTGIENLYSQFLFLDPDILGHTSYSSFKAEYCVMGGFENREIKHYRNIEKLMKIIDGHSDRVLEKDCLDLPKQRWKRRRFALCPPQQRLYDAYRKQSLAEIQEILGEDQGIKAAKEISIVRALRLQQISCGLSPEHDPKRLEGKNERMEALMQEVEECRAGGHKILIWCRFLPDLRDIHKALGPAAVGHYGGIGEDERILARKKIQTDDKTHYLVASRSAARSFTFTAADRSIYHSQNSSLDDRLQSQKRNHRIGTTTGVLYTDLELACRGSIDVKIINALRKHKSLADQINNDPASIFMEEEE
jgi:hypothetical protein